MSASPDGLAVGREPDLVRARSFLDALAAGPAALVIEGSAGIGKTTVWRAAATATTERGYRVIAATAVDLEADLPFVALRDLLDQVPPETAAVLPATQRRALDAALLRSSEPDVVADQHAVSVAVLGVVRALATERPLVIAIDDVGWIDRSSERVLRYVIRRLTTEPVGILATRRSGRDDAVPLGLDGRPVEERLHRIELGPLDAEQTFELLTGRAGITLPRRVCRTIHRVSGGNPFYAVEIGRAVQRTGHRVVTEDGLPLPSGVLAVTAARFDALSVPARRALSVVCLLTSPTVATASEAVGELGVEGLQEAADGGLLEITASGVAFTHPLLRAAAAASLSVRERRELHRELAAVVTDPDERAVHLAAGASGPDEAVARALDAAAHRAFAQGAPDTAAALAGRAVALTPPDLVGAWARRMTATAEYHYRVEDVAAARGLLEEVIAALPSGEHTAEARVWLATVEYSENNIVEAIEMARRALADAVDDRLKAAAERILAISSMVGGDALTGEQHAESALRWASAGTDRASVAESRGAVALTRFWRGRGLRADLMTAVAEPADWSRYAMHDGRPRIVSGLLLSWADQLDLARTTLESECHALGTGGQERPLAMVLFLLSELESRAGNWDRALHHADRGHRSTVLADDEFHRSLVLYARGLCHANRGRFAPALADAEAGLALATAARSFVGIGFNMALLGFIALSGGDHAAAHRHLGPISAQLPPGGAFDPGLVRFLPDEVEALVKLGGRSRAAELLAPFEAQAIALDRPWALGAAGRCRAVLLADAGDGDGALDAVEAALAAHERVAMPFERARTLLVAGSIRRRARRRREARAALDEALAEFSRLGAVAWAERATAEIGRLGGRAASSGALTGTEQRIAELVAAGQTNREVATALFVTVSTVEAALWKIYRKLDVRSRTELAARLGRSPGA